MVKIKSKTLEDSRSITHAKIMNLSVETKCLQGGDDPCNSSHSNTTLTPRRNRRRIEATKLFRKLNRTSPLMEKYPLGTAPYFSPNCKDNVNIMHNIDESSFDESLNDQQIERQSFASKDPSPSPLITKSSQAQRFFERGNALTSRGNPINFLTDSLDKNEDSLTAYCVSTMESMRLGNHQQVNAEAIFPPIPSLSIDITNESELKVDESLHPEKDLNFSEVKSSRSANTPPHKYIGNGVVFDDRDEVNSLRSPQENSLRSSVFRRIRSRNLRGNSRANAIEPLEDVITTENIDLQPKATSSKIITIIENKDRDSLVSCNEPQQNQAVGKESVASHGTTSRDSILMSGSIKALKRAHAFERALKSEGELELDLDCNCSDNSSLTFDVKTDLVPEVVLCEASQQSDPSELMQSTTTSQFNSKISSEVSTDPPALVRQTQDRNKVALSSESKSCETSLQPEFCVVEEFVEGNPCTSVSNFKGRGSSTSSPAIILQHKDREPKMETLRVKCHEGITQTVNDSPRETSLCVTSLNVSQTPCNNSDSSERQSHDETHEQNSDSSNMKRPLENDGSKDQSLSARNDDVHYTNFDSESSTIMTPNGCSNIGLSFSSAISVTPCSRVQSSSTPLSSPIGKPPSVLRASSYSSTSSLKAADTRETIITSSKTVLGSKADFHLPSIVSNLSQKSLPEIPSTETDNTVARKNTRSSNVASPQAMDDKEFCGDINLVQSLPSPLFPYEDIESSYSRSSSPDVDLELDSFRLFEQQIDLQRRSLDRTPTPRNDFMKDGISGNNCAPESLQAVKELSVVTFYKGDEDSGIDDTLNHGDSEQKLQSDLALPEDNGNPSSTIANLQLVPAKLDEESDAKGEYQIISLTEDVLSLREALASLGKTLQHQASLIEDQKQEIAVLKLECKLLNSQKKEDEESTWHDIYLTVVTKCTGSIQNVWKC
jgi:hypothetical protein